MTPPMHLMNRRAFFQQSGSGLGAMALGGLLGTQTGTQAKSEALRTHFAPRAKSVIYLHMIGAPSQFEMFEPKPALDEHDGEVCPESMLKGKRFAFLLSGQMRLAKSRFKFAQHGQSGHAFSELLPHLASVADDLCFIRSMHTEEINHAPAQMFLHSGFGRPGRPGIGSWLSYGLGTENADLPAYVVLLSGPPGGAGSSLWSSGFLPSVHQGVPFRSEGDPVLFLSNPEGHCAASRRRVLNAVNGLNHLQLAQARDPEISTRISQYEMAFKMQTSVPELMDITKESPSTLQMYGAQPGAASFANNCLLARRLVERGVRFVELFDSDWDHHNSLNERLPGKCRDIDQGCAALIRDLKARGLLEDTLIVWGSEFGRTPLAQRENESGQLQSPGRDHYKDAFTVWLAGGGVKPGMSFGKTDEMGFNITENPVHVHDLNATLLHLLGLDHEKLTYRYQGREFRLTDVHGSVLKEVLA